MPITPITLPTEAADSITVANMKDWHDYLEEEMTKWKNDPEINWIHPEDVVLNERYIDALRLLIPAFGGNLD